MARDGKSPPLAVDCFMRQRPQWASLVDSDCLVLAARVAGCSKGDRQTDKQTDIINT